jgi:hypothetical protein
MVGVCYWFKGEEMNERIKELMEQTGVPLSMPFDKWCEKFAELLEAAVRADEREACAKVCEKHGCRVYRFVDSGTHYFTRCGPQVETTRHYTESCGKGCTRARTETIKTEGNK